MVVANWCECKRTENAFNILDVGNLMGIILLVLKNYHML